MVGLAFLAQNCALGLSYGSFGPMLANTEQHFGISRGMASAAVSMALLVFALASPGVGILIQRTSVRTAMLAGGSACACGYLGLALAPSYALTLPFYAILGLGMSLLGVIAPVTLVSRWFVTGKAKAMGVVTLPILLLIVPSVIAEMLPTIGRAATYFTLASVFILLIPLLWLVVGKPADAGQRAWGDDAINQNAGDAPVAVPLTTRNIIVQPMFWLITLAVGCLSAAGIAFTIHLIPFGVEKHMTLIMASALLSTYAASGILGNLLLSWIADRFGAINALIGTAIFQAILACILLHANGPGLLLLIAGLLGVGAVPVVMLHGAIFGSHFGPVDVSRAMGLSYFAKVPFTLGAAPLVGFLFDRTGGYEIPLYTVAAVLLIAAVAAGLARILPGPSGVVAS